MKEKIRAKLRIAKMEMADPIASEAGVKTAIWSELPFTLRDDVVNITEEEPEEEEVYAHEQDAPIDYDVVGTGQRATGSFVEPSREQLVELMGGEAKDDKYMKSAKILMLNKAIKFTLLDGKEVIIPNAKGTVRMDLNLGKGGVSKYPFSFRLLQASPEWDCVIVY